MCFVKVSAFTYWCMVRFSILFFPFRFSCLDGIALYLIPAYNLQELGFFITVYLALRTRPSMNGEDHGKRRRNPYACTQSPTQL